MTLLDAPKFRLSPPNNAGRCFSTDGGVSVFAAECLVAGAAARRLAWNWNNYLFGGRTVNSFLSDVRRTICPLHTEYWIHDKNLATAPGAALGLSHCKVSRGLSSTVRIMSMARFRATRFALGRGGMGRLLVAILITDARARAFNLRLRPQTKAWDLCAAGWNSIWGRRRSESAVSGQQGRRVASQRNHWRDWILEPHPPSQKGEEYQAKIFMLPSKVFAMTLLCLCASNQQENDAQRSTIEPRNFTIWQEHAHAAASAAHGKGDHLTGHELSKKALEHR